MLLTLALSKRFVARSFSSWHPSRFAFILPVKSHTILFNWFAVLLWMGVIFGASTDPLSFPHTSQRFVPSREASVRDVLIDTLGAIFALTAIRAKASLCRQRGTRSLSDLPSGPQN